MSLLFCKTIIDWSIRSVDLVYEATPKKSPGRNLIKLIRHFNFTLSRRRKIQISLSRTRTQIPLQFLIRSQAHLQAPQSQRWQATNGLHDGHNDVRHAAVLCPYDCHKIDLRRSYIRLFCFGEYLNWKHVYECHGVLCHGFHVCCHWVYWYQEDYVYLEGVVVDAYHIEEDQD